MNGYIRSSEHGSTKELVMGMLSSLSTPEPTSTERCLANDCIKYFREEVDYTNSEYLNNLHTIASTDHVEMKHIGYVAAMMDTYIKFLNDLSKKEQNSEVVQEYLGEVGERLDLKIKDWKCLYHELNLFGDIYLYRFITESNQVVTWATSNCLEDRHILAIKGTVKEHLEYKGEKQTKLTRCKITYK